jgi:hypothetical protein
MIGVGGPLFITCPFLLGGRVRDRDTSSQNPTMRIRMKPFVQFTFVVESSLSSGNQNVIQVAAGLSGWTGRLDAALGIGRFRLALAARGSAASEPEIALDGEPAAAYGPGAAHEAGGDADSGPVTEPERGGEAER